MTTLNEWHYLIDDGDVRIDYKVREDKMIEIKHTKHLFDANSKVNAIEIFYEEIEDIVNTAKIIFSKQEEV